MSTGKKYFGTDGIRGRVDGDVINPEFFRKLGLAAGRVLASGEGSKVIIGRDTRESGDLLAMALAAGLSEAGVNVLLSGIVPTPAVAYLTHTLRAQAGVVISASHNPYYDNGIKFFDESGHKLSDDAEFAIESLMDEPLLAVASGKKGKITNVDDADSLYIQACKSLVTKDFSLAGMTIVVDCAHGAAHHIAPTVLSELGANIIPIGVQPDGLNINLECGATSLSAIQKAVIDQSADLGVALDGDADRIMMIDQNGEVIDGDQIIYMIVRDRVRTGTMQGPVVGTLMSNLGLEKAIRSLGLDFIRAGVGDRYVMQELHQSNGIIGGEPSGHVISLDKATTGDGTVAALQVLSAMVAEEMTLADLSAGMQLYPQTMVNVKVPKIMQQNDLLAAKGLVAEAEEQLKGMGRVLLRPSGTEPLIRVMVEGEDEVLVANVANQLAERVSDFL